MKRCTVFVLISLLSGCSILLPIQVTDERTGLSYVVPSRLYGVPGIRELAEACVTKAERVVHRTVEVEGYFSHGSVRCELDCWSEFAQSPYEYMEFEVRKPKSWHFLKEEGLWRISKQDVDDPRCEKKPTKYVKRISERDGWPIDFCLAFEQPKSKLSQFTTAWVGEVLHDDIDGVTEISLSVMQVKEIESGEVLGFSAYPNLFLARGTGGSVRSYGCLSIGVEHSSFQTNSSLLRQVLK